MKMAAASGLVGAGIRDGAVFLGAEAHSVFLFAFLSARRLRILVLTLSPIKEPLEPGDGHGVRFRLEEALAALDGEAGDAFFDFLH
jgi:hypothetical protein